MTDANVRYAVYFAPAEDSPFARFGAWWLGRDAWSGEALLQPSIDDISPVRLTEMTASARHYGLHATLKPPFVLSQGSSVGELEAALEALAAGRQPLEFGVRLVPLAGFLAWQPTSAFSELADVAAACVTELDGFRRAMDAAEFERRRRVGLNVRQIEMLRCWGYPYVLDEFRFHITLSDLLAPCDARRLQSELEHRTESFATRTIRFDALCLFVQSTPDADFRLVARYGFDGTTQRHPEWRP